MNSLVVFIATLTVYLFFMHPSLPGGDAGELLSEACILGTAHPPGYPLFTLISHLSIQVGSWVSAAKAVNFICCVMGASTGSIMYLLIDSYLRPQPQINLTEGSAIRLDIDNVIKSSAVTGSALFSFAPLTMEYHTSSEVFALNNLLVSLILYQVLRISSATRKTLISESILGAFLGGLALSNQHTSALFLLPIIVYVFIILLSRLDQGIGIVILKLILSFSVGLSPYLYLAAFSHQPSAGSWGDFTTIRGFLKHILRSEYGTFSLSAGQNSVSVEDALSRWKVYFNSTIDQFSYLGGTLFIIGLSNIIFKMIRPFNKTLDSFGLTAILCMIFYLLAWNGVLSNLPLSIPMAYEVHARFWMQPNLIYSFLIGLGSKTVLSFVFHYIPSRTIAYSYTYCVILTSILVYYASRGASTLLDSKAREILYDYADSIVKTIPNRSLLLSHSDLNWNSVRYLQTCELSRLDVTHISIQLLPFPWFQRQIKAGLYPHVIFPDILPNVSTSRFDEGNTVLISRFLRSNLKTGAFPGGIFIEMLSIADSDIGPNGLYHEEFSLIPWGLVYRVLPVMDNPKVDLPNSWYPLSIKSTHMVRNSMKQYSNIEFRKGSWEYAAISVFWDMHYQLGIHMLSFALYISKYLTDDHVLIPKYAQMLKDASKLLDQVYRVMNKSQATSYPYYDIVKNTALAYMRLYEFSLVVPKLEGHVHSRSQMNHEDPSHILSRTKEIVQQYVKLNKTDDKDFPVFNAFYKSLSEREP